MKRAAPTIFALSFATLAVAAGRASAGDVSAEEIVQKNLAARGGLEAWRKVQTMVWIGHIESGHAPMPSMPFELSQKRPDKARMEIIALTDKSVRVFDGTYGWNVRSSRGRQTILPYNEREVRYAQEGPGIDAPLLHHAAGGATVTLVGVDDLGDRKAYHLSVTTAKGSHEDVWVDVETYLEARVDRFAEVAGGSPRRVSTTYGDYRATEGLQIPFLITTGGGPGATPDRIRIEKVVLNSPLDDSTFGNPAAPRPRHGARSRIAARAQRPSAFSAPAVARAKGGPGP